MRRLHTRVWKPGTVPNEKLAEKYFCVVKVTQYTFIEEVRNPANIAGMKF